MAKAKKTNRRKAGHQKGKPTKGRTGASSRGAGGGSSSGS